MLLTHMRMIRDRARRGDRERTDAGAADRGSGLILVIAVMSVLLCLTLVVAGMTTQAFAVTTSTRAAVQAQSFAEAGIDYAAAQLSGGTVCSPQYASPAGVGTPVFTTTVSYSTSDVGDVWMPCPVAGADKAKRVKIISTGTAVAKGVVGASAGDLRKVEAVYTYIPPDPIPATGAAVYSYSAGTFNDFEVKADTSVDADIFVKSGNFSCTNSTSHVAGSVFVAAGTANLDNGCRIDRNVWASGIITAQHATIGGNVLSAERSAQSRFGPSTRVGGFIDLASNAFTDASRCPAPNNGWDENGYKCALKQTIATGSVTFHDLSVGAPVIPGWLEYDYSPTAWATAGFDTSKPWPSTSCNIDNTVIASSWFATAITNLASPTVYDTRASCPGGLTFVSGSHSYSMKTDVAFIAKSFRIQGLTLKSADAAAHRAWFITPDTNATDGIPTCAGGAGDVNVNSNVSIQVPINALVYTPCDMRNSTNSWRGQFYGRKIAFDSNSGLVFHAVGLPGADLTSGTTAPPGVVSGGALGALISQRDRDVP